MTHYWLHIPIEVKQREFHSRLILAALAIDRGFDVLLGKDQMFRRLAPILPKGIMFDKSLGTDRHGKTRRYNGLGHKVVVHEEEATGYFGSPEQIIRTRMENETLALCETWYCLNDGIRRDASAIFPGHKDKFLVTGLMRTDVWRRNFLDFYKDESEKIQSKFGPFILFNSNFGTNIHARGAAFVRKQERGMRKAYDRVEEAKPRIKIEGKPNLEAFVEIIPKIASWFPDHKIIIRPHPSEDVQFWKNAYQDHDRVLVEREGVATPWILASDMLLHHGCTTGIESEILGKQHVMYAPYPDAHHDTEVMSTFAPIVKSEDELWAFMKENLKVPIENRNSDQKGKYFANLDGTLVSEAIMKDLEQKKFRSGGLSTKITLPIRLRMLIAKYKFRSKRDIAYSKQKWPGADIREIKEGLAIAAAGLGLAQNPTIREPFEEVWHIRQD